MTADQVTFVLVNVNQVEPRSLVVQAGAYAEHQFLSVATDDQTKTVNAPQIAVNLAPGAGSRITAQWMRYANQPTLRFPW